MIMSKDWWLTGRGRVEGSSADDSEHGANAAQANREPPIPAEMFRLYARLASTCLKTKNRQKAFSSEWGASCQYGRY